MLKRHFITGEWEDVEPQGHQFYVYEGKKEKSSCSAICTKRPLVSRSIGVHPSQARRFTEEARRAGIKGVEYCPKTGVATFTSRGARKRECIRRGKHDQDGGYGDACG